MTNGTYPLQLTLEQVGYTVGLLAKQPYAEVAALINSIQMQAQAYEAQCAHAAQQREAEAKASAEELVRLRRELAERADAAQMAEDSWPKPTDVH